MNEVKESMNMLKPRPLRPGDTIGLVGVSGAMHEPETRFEKMLEVIGDLGYKVIIDNNYQGLVYSNQIFRPIHIGAHERGYIDRIRPDGKLDVMLQPSGRQQTTEFTDVLTDYLIAHDGFCPYGDKTDPELIRDIFGVSKKTFKRAIGDLYRRHVILITEEGLRLTPHH